MGLDAYLLKIERPRKSELAQLEGLTTDQIEERGYHYILDECFNTCPEQYESLSYHARKITAKMECFDRAACFHYYGIDTTSQHTVSALRKDGILIDAVFCYPF
jgi:hypothetical protein